MRRCSSFENDRGQHPRVLARAVALQWGRRGLPQDEAGRDGGIGRGGAAALQIGGGETDLVEHRRDLALVPGRTRVRGAAERQLCRGEGEGVGRAAFDRGDGLERFGRRAKEDDPLRVPRGRDDLARGVDGNSPPPP
jgi:hypothetical protein